VRELKHVADFVTATLDGDRIEPADLPDEIAALRSPVSLLPPTPPPGAAMRKLSDELEEIERLRMTEALARAHGIKTKAAALLGMPIRTFNMRVKQYGL
jgi:two-component system response regulator AtoC